MASEPTRRALLRDVLASCVQRPRRRPVATRPPGPSTTDIDEPRYLGLRAADETRPYARYMHTETLPMQEHVQVRYTGPPSPSNNIPRRDELADDLNRADYSAAETGFGLAADGQTVWVAVLTHMPGVTAAMWDWWFGWHSVESARYRLWHPDAHAYSAIKHDTRGHPHLTDRERYVGNTSYVDEFIGGQLSQLAIRFRDPADVGLRVGSETTVIHASVGSSELPFDIGYLAHQVRPVSDGAEMRSRFYLNVPRIAPLDLRAARAAHRRGDLAALAQPLPVGTAYARDLMEHCAREMNHLASFLPELYEQFGIGR